ncbi:hypothetical protein LNP05_29570 [Klebsiella pneumoniae subsp. pneumoniae]|nr:hypothetical protein [Klebsiella pneumoniae subsp. pneumoniae]
MNWPPAYRPSDLYKKSIFYSAGKQRAEPCMDMEKEPMRGFAGYGQVYTFYPDRALIGITGKIFNGNFPRRAIRFPVVKGGPTG